MAGPLFRIAGSRAQSASAATLTPTKPTVDTNGAGLLVCVVTSKNNAVHSTATTGWTKLGQINSGANFTSSIFYAAQAAAAPVITWTGAAACSAQVLYFTDPQNTLDITVAASSSAAGTGTPHTSTAFTSTRANALALYIDLVASNSSPGTPTGWTNVVQTGSATDAGATNAATKATASSGSSSGATSVAAAAVAWTTWQLELRGAAPGPFDVSKAESDVWLTPPADQLAVAKLEASVWLVPNDNMLKFGKIEVDLWLTAAPVTRRGRLLFSSF